jgi:outer membrane receptor protein involved in Fe transport
LLFIFNTGVFSQAKISGIVIDAKEYTPVEGVTVKILNTIDSSLVNGTSTDAKGLFTISGINPGKYKISFDLIGYKNSKRTVLLKDSSASINLDTIKLFSDSYTTEEINVESEIPEMRFEDEKKVFNVEKIASTRGGTALDVLRKIPMIDVDINDNVTLRGSSQVLILVDNKPMKFASLRQVPAEAIKEVEIITNPSAKYDAEGVTGIINLVMQPKNDNVIGYSGYTQAGIKSNLEGGYANLGLTFNKNKWSLFLNGGGGIFQFNNSFNAVTNYDNPLSSYLTNSDGTGKSKYGYISLGVEYELNKGHSIGTDLNFNVSKYDNTSSGLSKSLNSSGVLNSQNTVNFSGDGNFRTFGTSLYYNGKFDKLGKELNVDLYYGNDNNSFNSIQDLQYYDSLTLPIPNPTNQKNTTGNNNWNVKLQADYSNPFNDKTKFETGVKSTFRSNDNDYTYDTLNYILNSFVRNYDLTNHFKMKENISAVYGTFSHKIKDFKFKAGLRLEYTHTTGDLITTGFNFTKEYFDLFPTLSFSQKLNDINELQISYTRRITRPNIWRLNPFVNKYNSRYINIGNPELTPEFTDSYELNHNLYSKVLNLTTSVFYRKSYDVISAYGYLLDSLTSVTTYRNDARAQSYGADFIIRSNAIKWLGLNATFSMYQTKFDGSIINDYKGEEGFSWRANVRSNINISELFSIEIYYNYNGKRFTATGFNVPNQNLDISLNMKFLEKKMSVGLRAEDIFKTRKWGGENDGIGFRTVNNSSWDSRVIFLNLSYNFGNTDKYYQKSKNTKQNENENQDVKDNNQ